MNIIAKIDLTDTGGKKCIYCSYGDIVPDQKYCTDCPTYKAYLLRINEKGKQS